MKNKIFISNTILLYILKFSNYFFSFITIPLQTRILGPQMYANLTFFLAISVYFQNFIDFGFTLSSTEKISKSDDENYINEIFSKVIFGRLFLILISNIIFFILILTNDTFKNNILIFSMYYFSAIVIAFMPDFLYLGLQNMRAITYRTIISRLVFTLLLFLFLRDKSQYLLIPILTILGNLISLIFIFCHIFFVLKIKLIKIRFIEIINEIKYTFQFFLSRISLTIYQSLNTVITGLVFGTNSYDLGFYKPAEQSINFAKQSFFPIIDSLYPFMAKYNDFKLYKKILLYGIFIISIGTIFVDIFAYKIVVLVFGSDYYFVGKYLRILSPSVLLGFLTMMCGFPILTSMGLIKYANYSNIFSAIIHIIILFILFITKNITVLNLCILTNITEFNTFFYRFFIILLYRKRIVYEKNIIK